eukprot:TRINITY_DN7535_c0_g1_i1.p1 TRINITY_DN7535_c0_g1~~TRINITY_DN7535_c0_g1_i1.p1  ORF type:complete len:183 (+),score=17.48 TRINITY_DN7535_c0_g1_i1:101-649(+)
MNTPLQWIYEMEIINTKIAAGPTNLPPLQWHQENQMEVDLTAEDLSSEQKRIIFRLYDLIDSRFDVKFRGDKGMSTRLTMTLSNDEMEFMIKALKLQNPTVCETKRRVFPHMEECTRFCWKIDNIERLKECFSLVNISFKVDKFYFGSLEKNEQKWKKVIMTIVIGRMSLSQFILFVEKNFH